MPATPTESIHRHARNLDMRTDHEALSLLLDGQREALAVVGGALGEIAAGAALMADAVRGGGRLVYAGAGSSGLMAMADGLELAGTFGIDPARVILCMAGGMPQDATMPGGTEDDMAEGERTGAAFGPADAIIAVTASGSTPYAVALARAAHARRAPVIALANSPGAAIFSVADVAVCLPTPPELVAGSTRMGAGTAQKVALNLMSTLMGMRLGAVHDGMMVALRADNAKLRLRARTMVAQIAGVEADAAARALDAAEGRVRIAVLVARGAAPGEAEQMIEANGGILRAALARWEGAGNAG